MKSAIVYDRRGPQAPRISFLVPVYNERPSILSVLDRLAKLPFSKEIIIVDDGSRDGTRELLTLSPLDGAALFFHEKNGGKGRAIRTGLENARGACVAIQDADLEYAPEEYASLLDAMEKQGAQAVFGSRFLRPNPNIYKRYLLGNKVLTAVTNMLCGSNFTDTYTCYKLIQTPVMKSLEISSSGFEMEAEISAKVALRGVPFAECPITYNPRKIEEGKKIGWKDAVKGIVTVLKLSWTERAR